MELKKLKEIYDRMAPNYDLFHKIMFAIFFVRDSAYRRRCIEIMNLKRGSVVLDIACGTGANFKYIEDKIGKNGRISGIDYSRNMLAMAEKMIKRNNWRNIKLMHADAAKIKLRPKFDAIICTWAIFIMPDYEKAIENACKSLKKGAKFVVIGEMLTDHKLGGIINPIAVQLSKICGVSRSDMQRKPWVEMEKYLKNVKVEKYYFGLFYIAYGTK